MKKYIVLFFAIFLVFSAYSLAQTTFQPTDQPQENQLQQEQQQSVYWLSVVNNTCRPCLEGEKTKFDIRITNVQGPEFIVRSAYLVDSTGVVFASSSPNEVIGFNETETIYAESVLPPAIRGKALYYSLCMDISIQDQTTQSCESTVRRMQIDSPVEQSLFMVYILLATILVVNTIFFLLFLRRLDKHKK